MRLSFITGPVDVWLEGFRYFRPFRVRFGELDAFGHVNNVVYFRYFEQARIDYFGHLGLFTDLFTGPSSGLIVVAQQEAHYLKPLYFGDAIDVGVRCARLGRTSLTLEYAVLRRPRPDGDARAGTVQAAGEGGSAAAGRGRPAAPDAPPPAGERNRTNEAVDVSGPAEPAGDGSRSAVDASEDRPRPERLVAAGRSVLVHLDRERKAPAALPEAVRAVLSAFDRPEGADEWGY
ncbi:MAG: acyl-CoA thioesterase [Hydrogenibacillus schlegelii]|nr:acyl-CoA thioesterase [Hydrogenibacillus schlegelii]